MRAVNLLPRDAERARRTAPDPALLIGAAGLAVVIAALLSMFLSASQKLDDTQREHRELEATLAAINKISPPPKVLPIQIKIASVQAERIKAVSDALAYRIPWDYILGQIALALPSGVKLTSLRATTPLSPNPQFSSLAGSTAAATTSSLEISGWTYSQESVGLFMTRLQVLPALVRNSVTLDSSMISSPGSERPYYEFSISARIRTPGAIT